MCYQACGVTVALFTEHHDCSGVLSCFPPVLRAVLEVAVGCLEVEYRIWV